MGKYDDIINLPHPVSVKHAHLSPTDRGAQFAPFAALTGYDEDVIEAGRLTESRIDIADDVKSSLDNKLKAALASPASSVSLTYFKPDALKLGGRHITVSGVIKKLDDYSREVIMADGLRIPIDNITDINLLT